MRPPAFSYSTSAKPAPSPASFSIEAHVTGRDEHLDADRRQADAVLVRLPLARDTDVHGTSSISRAAMCYR